MAKKKTTNTLGATDPIAPESRDEAALQNMLGASNPLEPPQSRIELLLHKLLGEDVTPEAPQSRIENLLTEMVNQGFGPADSVYATLLATEWGTE